MGIIESIQLQIILSVFAVIFCFGLYFKLKNEIKQESDTKCGQELANRDFVVSKCIEIPCHSGGFFDIRHYSKFLVDDEHKKFAIFYCKRKKHAVLKEFNYSDLTDFNLYENGMQQIEGRGTLSAVGALAFGPAGAIVGASTSRNIYNICTELAIKIQVNDLEDPLQTIVCVNRCGKQHPSYIKGRQIAEDIIATLTYIANNSDNNVKESA